MQGPINLHRIVDWISNRAVENVNHTSYQKRCLLSYINYPFLFPFKPQSHQSHMQVKTIAKIVNDFGYNVDVVNYSGNYKLTKQYDLVIDIHPTVKKQYWKHLNLSAKKIILYTGSYPEFQNKAELKRLDNLMKRKGIRLQPRRQVESIDLSLFNQFDALFLIGNEQTKQTFPTIKIPTFLLPNTADENYPVLPMEQKKATSFLFLGSGGQVHKGLDLVLEVFSRHPELELFVCSPFEKETDFVRLYYKELFQTPNIHPIGFVDVYGKKFKEIASVCSYLIHPSASEAVAGSVLMGMSVGLIPIVSKETGTPEAIQLKDTTIATLEQTIRTYVAKDHKFIEKESLRMKQIIGSQYFPEKYEAKLRAAFKKILQ